MMAGTERITLALTGASGSQYGLRLLDCLVQEEREVPVSARVMRSGPAIMPAPGRRPACRAGRRSRRCS